MATPVAVNKPRTFVIEQATRQALSVKMALDGPSGAGKTTGALLLAYGMCRDWSQIAVADTENRSALYLVGRDLVQRGGQPLTVGRFMHVPFDPPYDPRHFVSLIRQVEMTPAKVLIIDSLSHEWSGKGGCLELQQNLGGKYQDWAKVTPMHQDVIDAIRHSRLHIIATMRSKQDYAMEQEQQANGVTKTKVVKLGMKTEQRDGMDYEMGIVLDIEHKTHYATCNKDRTGLFDGRPPFVIGVDTGEEIATWAAEGDSPRSGTMYHEVGSPEWTAEKEAELLNSATMADLQGRFALLVSRGLSKMHPDTIARLTIAKDQAKARLSAIHAITTPSNDSTTEAA